jgi:hypothetical protein
MDRETATANLPSLKYFIHTRRDQQREKLLNPATLESTEQVA